VSRPLQHVGDGGQPLVRVDEFGGADFQVRGRRLGGEDFVRQPFQPAAARQAGQRLLLRLERQVQIFQPPQRIRRVDAGGQFGRQLAGGLQRFQNSLPAIRQNSQAVDHLLDSPNLFFIQSAGLVLAVPRDKRHRIAIVQQLDRDRHFFQGQGEFSRHLPKLNLNRRFHRRPARRLLIRPLARRYTAAE